MPNKGTPAPRRVNQATIQNLQANGKVSRVGVTNDPKRRFSEYSREKKYQGQKMVYAHTDNQKRVEDKLLENGKPKHNIQQHSNAPQSKGYVYGLVPKDTRVRKSTPAQRGGASNHTATSSQLFSALGFGSYNSYSQFSQLYSSEQGFGGYSSYSPDPQFSPEQGFGGYNSNSPGPQLYPPQQGLDGYNRFAPNFRQFPRWY